MSWRLSWLPFAGLLVILPYPGTVAARLLLLLLTFICSLIWYFRASPSAWAPLPCKPAFAFWWLVGLISLTYAADPGYSFGELKNEFGYTLLALFAFFLIGQRCATATFALRAAALGMGILCGWATLTWLGEGYAWNRLGRHGDAGVVSTYVVTVLPVLLCIAVGDPLVHWRRAAGVIAVLALFIAAITEQRAAWIAIALELAIAAALLARGGRIRLSHAQVVVTMAVLLSLGVIAILSYSFLRHGNAEALPRDARMDFWPSVLAVISAHPFAGAGFGRQSMKMAYPDLIPGYNRELWHAHNFVLNYGLSMGLPGIAALLALFAAWGRFFWRHAAQPAGIAGCMLLAGVFLRNQFNDFFQRDMSLLFWALCGLFAGMLLARAEVSR